MAKNTPNADIAALAAAGVHVEIPQIEVAEDPGSIDLVTQDADLREIAADEAFMSQVLKIRIATTTDPNAPPFATLVVNDVRNRVQVPRGVVVPIKRMLVEVLARMRETAYTQNPRNPMDPESGNQLVPRHAAIYPFEVIHDPHPRGRAWLERILAEPNY